MTKLKSKHCAMLIILIAIVAVGVITVNVHQVSAPRACGGCVAFKKLTHEFEKSVIEAATTGDPNTIPGLLEQYSSDVRALDIGG
jgi:hypothetical protein